MCSERYGADRVAQIITFGKLQARAVLRDVGRVLQMPYGQVDRLCKLVPNNPANPVTLAQAIAGEPRLQEARDAEPIGGAAARDRPEARGPVPPRLDPCRRRGDRRPAARSSSCRSTATRASSLPATQFNMKWVEPAGLVKFDFLGLKTLTVIEKARELLARSGRRRSIRRGAPRRPRDLRAARARRHGRRVPAGRLRACATRCASCKPDRFEDIIAIVALYRPGPMDNIPSYIDRKHGREQPDYLHPLIAADPGRDLRRHHLPGAGDADRPGPLRLLARRSRSAAPRHGQEDQGGDGRSSGTASSRARSGKGVDRGAAPSSSSSWSPSSPATASTNRTPRPMR